MYSGHCTLYFLSLSHSSLLRLCPVVWCTLHCMPCPCPACCRTELHQSATITVKNIPFLSGTLENLMLSNYDGNAQNVSYYLMHAHTHTLCFIDLHMLTCIQEGVVGRGEALGFIGFIRIPLPRSVVHKLRAYSFSGTPSL